MKIKTIISTLVFSLLFLQHAVLARKVNEFPKRTDPLHLKVEMFDKLMRGNNWNEGLIMQRVIYPPAGLDRPVIGPHADCLDTSTELLVAYTHKYAITKDPADRDIANQLFEAILKTEFVTGIPGLIARGYYKTDSPLWHEETMWYKEWHWSTTMPGYRWLGDLSSDKFTSIFYGVGTYWEFCADEEHKQKAADLLDRFMGRVVDNNFKLVDPDGKMTLWGNFCPDLPHQPLNSLIVLAGLKTAYVITGNQRFENAYFMLINRYNYDDHQIMAKIIWPPEWRNVGDDYHAARSLYMLMRYEKDRSLLTKYKMDLDRHWYDWQNHDFTWESSIWYIMLYQVLTGEDVLTEKYKQVIKDMWGFDRRTQTFSIPTKNGFKTMESKVDERAAAMIRNYWFGRYYGLINPDW